MKKGTRAALPIIALALTVALATGGLAAAPSQITSIAASASGATVSVTGTASFGGQDPVIVGEDPVGDNVGAGPTSAIGLDIEKMVISQPDANTASLLFTLKLGGMQGGGIPEGVQYNWDISVDGGAAAGGTNRSIKTMRSRASATQNTNPYAAIYNCVPSATGFSCTEVLPRLAVVYDAATAEIRITVPMAMIGANPGSLIEAWPRATNPVWIGPSASGATTLTNIFDTATHDPYNVPTKSVMAGLAPAGQAVSFTTSAFVSGSGSFSATLTAPGSGAFDVAARACFAGNCGTGTTQVTV